MFWLGIDYGAKLAGTTAISFVENNQIKTLQSVKKQDADAFCTEWVSRLKPNFIMIDAPLSLPLAYFGKGDDYFYRKADRQLKAMSPLFLGGLTARAMRLANQWTKQGISVYESYPRMVAQLAFGLSNKAEKAIKDAVINYLKTEGLQISEASFQSGHALDSVLAWISGKRLTTMKAVITGDAEEGLIYS
ncbi:MAG: hypothetical protein RBR87_13810 [Bacteroidales bacterium]|jgi:predicted nuclease with RNAse H fold|nr:hypothetical protein [Bacteroidales bacterium]